MTNVVRPFITQQNVENWELLIEDLYARGDSTASHLSLKPIRRKPLSQPEDISIVADVIEALKDEEQARLARPMLRHALKEVARILLNAQRPEPDMT
ncbi:MAG: hypothetical protein WBF53_05275 [Litorimonas sp.]